MNEKKPRSSSFADAFKHCRSQTKTKKNKSEHPYPAQIHTASSPALHASVKNHDAHRRRSQPSAWDDVSSDASRSSLPTITRSFSDDIYAGDILRESNLRPSTARKPASLQNAEVSTIWEVAEVGAEEVALPACASSSTSKTKSKSKQHGKKKKKKKQKHLQLGDDLILRKSKIKIKNSFEINTVKVRKRPRRKSVSDSDQLNKLCQLNSETYIKKYVPL
mmetsp:Transcript_34950/g.57053  ORF Transcript_34950/g.57053 Transcript_34950/m.57053 type:complete len:220 (+) Transcript_34950:1-660(+)